MDGNLHKSILDSLDDGIMVLDTEFTISEVNSAWEEITGFTRADAVNTRCFEICAGKYCKASCDIEKAYATGESPPDFEISIMHKNGGRRIVRIRTKMISDKKNGEVTGCVRFFSDITRSRDIERLTRERSDYFGIIGRSERMRKVYEIIDNISGSPLPVLIQGETGTGKELVCDAIHLSSLRSHASLIKVNISSFSENLIEAELFGYERGSFTGADCAKAGWFELADRGSIFLDEIGTLSEKLQVKLLRVIENNKFIRVGGRREKESDVRVISATNLDLKQEVLKDRFRKDLFFRLSAVTIQLPPLRERKEDIPLLVEHFIRRMNDKGGKEIAGVTQDALNLLLDYSWPGNVRELKNVIEYACLVAKGGEITGEDLHGLLEWMNAPAGEDNEERSRLNAVLHHNKWNLTKTAASLGIDRTTLWRRMKKAGIERNP